MESIFILFMPGNMSLVIAGEGITRMHRPSARNNPAYVGIIQVLFTETPIFVVVKRVVAVI
jgi:hypothetical protein